MTQIFLSQLNNCSHARWYRSRLEPCGRKARQQQAPGHKGQPRVHPRDNTKAASPDQSQRNCLVQRSCLQCRRGRSRPQINAKASSLDQRQGFWPTFGRTGPSDRESKARHQGTSHSKRPARRCSATALQQQRKRAQSSWVKRGHISAVHPPLNQRHQARRERAGALLADREL